MPRITVALAGSLNRCALLDAIAACEIGVDMLNNSDDGYNVLVGSLPGAIHTFPSYADHPHIHVAVVNSDAAGRYQIMGRFWPHYRDLLNLPDFDPVSQDLYALQQFKERGILDLIDAGDLTTSVAKINNIWASLPGSPYNQNPKTFDFVKAAYILNGGTFVQ